MYLKVSPIRDIVRFDKKWKLSPRYVGPFRILGMVGPVVYCVEVPTDLAGIHNVFHVSQLQKCVHDPQHIISYELLDIQLNLTYEEQPIQILDRKE